MFAMVIISFHPFSPDEIKQIRMEKEMSHCLPSIESFSKNGFRKIEQLLPILQLFKY